MNARNILSCSVSCLVSVIDLLGYFSWLRLQIEIEMTTTVQRSQEFWTEISSKGINLKLQHHFSPQK